MRVLAFAFLWTALTCGAVSTESTPEKAWKITLTSAGGLAGRGNGSWMIDSAGALQVTTIAGKTCAFQATNEEVAQFSKLLAAAKRKEWKASYEPASPCCDRFEYDLTIEEGGVTTTTHWIVSAESMPADLVALAEALVDGAENVRSKYGPQCQ